MNNTWNPLSSQPAEVGNRAALCDCRAGWLVEDIQTGIRFTVWGTFENRTRVYRDGDDSLNLLPNDTPVEIVDISRQQGSWYDGQFKPGDVVKVLYPSKNGGKTAIVVKGDYRYHLLEIGGGKVFYVERDFLVKLPGKWELTQR